MARLNHAGQASFISGIVMVVLSTAAVIVRLMLRWSSKPGFAADDWLIILGLIGFWAWTGVLFWGIFAGGGGADIQSISFDFATLQSFLKSLYTLNALNYVAIIFVKLSILTFYCRIFTTRNFQRTAMALGAVCIVWAVVSEITTLLPCRPPQTLWDTSHGTDTCFNFAKFWLGSEIVDTITDFLILCLPVRMILQLKMSSKKKAMLSGLFLMGSFVCITGIVRLCLVYKPGSAFVVFTQAELWGNIHIGTAIISACLPMYRPLLLKIKVVTSNILSSYGYLFSRHSSRHQTHTGSHQLDQMTHKANNYGEIESLPEHTAVVSTAPPGEAGPFKVPREEWPVNSIRATKTVEVV